MELKSFGCSFIYGVDLPDADPPDKASDLTWPALVAEKFNLGYSCHAGGGQGNLALLDRLSQEIHRDPTALFVIQWTYIDRFDYSDPLGHHYNQGHNDWRALLPSSACQPSDFYFRHLHSEYRDKLTACIYMKTALDLLTDNCCKFFMTCIDPLIFCDRYHVTDPMKSWQTYIESNMHWFEGQNFVTWSRSHGHALGVTGHPLETAHSQAAELVYPVIDAILHRV